MIEDYTSKRFFVMENFDLQGQNISQGDVLITGKKCLTTNSGKQILDCDSLIGDAAFLILNDQIISGLIETGKIVIVEKNVIVNLFKIYNDPLLGKIAVDESQPDKNS